MRSCEMPASLEAELRYAKSVVAPGPLAVRSSAPDEDGTSRTFAGMHASCLGVPASVGALRDAVMTCWVSTFSPEALYYRLSEGDSPEGGMAVIIQQMVKADAGGVAMTSFPDDLSITVEATWGLGGLLGSGQVDPDCFIVDAATLNVRSETIGKKAREQLLTPAGVVVQKCCRADEASIDQKAIETIARCAREMGRAGEGRQVIEWARAGGDVLFLQARTAPAGSRQVVAAELAAAAPEPVISGTVFNPDTGGMAQDKPARGCVLVVGKCLPRYVRYLGDASAVVAEEGGLLNHLAIVCRELSIPFIVLPGATRKLRNGEHVRISAKPDSQALPSPGDTDVRVFSYVPSYPPEERVEADRRAVVCLPRFLGKAYRLEIVLKRQGMYISRGSYERFVGDAIANAEVLHQRLGSYEDMDDRERFAVAVLAMLLVEPLMTTLSEVIGDRGKALSLIRPEDASYLAAPDERTNTALCRFAPEDRRIVITKSIWNRAAESRDRWAQERQEILRDAKDPKRAETFAGLIRLLTVAYEDKDIRVRKVRNSSG